MKTACFFQQPDLLIGNILQICIPQRINPYCRPLTMINILPIIHTARVMKVGKQSYYKRIHAWGKQSLPILIDTIPMTYSMYFSKCPLRVYILTYFFYYLLHIRF